jgi:hypothetical protein
VTPKVRRVLAAVVLVFASLWRVVRLIQTGERRKLENGRAKRQLDSMTAAKRVREDVENDTDLDRRASRWVRKKP